MSTRKSNQFDALVNSYQATVDEGTEVNTAWCALNAVTRYVDHERSARGDDTETLARFRSSQFGSGAAMKAKAWNLLQSMEKTLGVEPQGVPVDMGRLEAMLAQ